MKIFQEASTLVEMRSSSLLSKSEMYEWRIHIMSLIIVVDGWDTWVLLLDTRAVLCVENRASNSAFGKWTLWIIHMLVRH